MRRANAVLFGAGVLLLAGISEAVAPASLKILAPKAASTLTRPAPPPKTPAIPAMAPADKAAAIAQMKTAAVLKSVPPNSPAAVPFTVATSSMPSVAGVELWALGPTSMIGNQTIDFPGTGSLQNSLMIGFPPGSYFVQCAVTGAANYSVVIWSGNAGAVSETIPQTTSGMAFAVVVSPTASQAEVSIYASQPWYWDSCSFEPVSP